MPVKFLGAIWSKGAPLWSLTLEKVFYLSFPVTAVVLRRAWLDRSLPDELVFLPFIVMLVILMGLLHTWFSEPSRRFVRKHFAPALASRDTVPSL